MLCRFSDLPVNYKLKPLNRRLNFVKTAAFKPLIALRGNPPGLRVVVGQNFVPKLFTPYCKLLCYCFKYLIKRNLF